MKAFRRIGRIRRIGVVTLVLMSVCLGAAVLSGDARGFIGQPLAEGTKQDFFTFFHFKEEARDKLDGGDTRLMYGTVCMGNPVVLGVVVGGKDETIRLMTLTLYRKFVDDQKMGLFARDVAKSFLAGCVPEADFPAVSTLVNEISYGGGGEVIRAGATPKLPDKPSAGYAAYLGKGPDFEKKLSQCRLVIENKKTDKGSPYVVLGVMK